MKKFFMIAACFLFLFKGEVAHAQEGKIKLQDVTNGVYWPKQIDGVNPMNDGESYTQLSPDHKRIVRHSFKTGKEIATVFDVETARGSKNSRALTAISCRLMSIASSYRQKQKASTVAHTPLCITSMTFATTRLSRSQKAVRSRFLFSLPMETSLPLPGATTSSLLSCSLAMQRCR